MKIVAGIDFEFYPFALAFLNRLKPNSASIDLIHVVESVLPDRSFPDFASTHPLEVIRAERHRQGNAELGKAAELLAGKSFEVHQTLVEGETAGALLGRADEIDADWIAVGSGHKGTWGSLFFGSVTKALTSRAHQSVLVAKSVPTSPEGIHAVFAFDNSEYCDKCIDAFLGWQLTGVKKVTIMQAIAPIIFPGIEGDLVKLNEEIFSEASERAEAIRAKFEAAGYEAKVAISRCHVNEGIEAVMKSSGADLLVLGARGHGFINRVVLGSVSHYQVVATPHNVLVIRV